MIWRSSFRRFDWEHCGVQTQYHCIQIHCIQIQALLLGRLCSQSRHVWQLEQEGEWSIKRWIIQIPFFFIGMKVSESSKPCLIVFMQELSSNQYDRMSQGFCCHFSSFPQPAIGHARSGWCCTSTVRSSSRRWGHPTVDATQPRLIYLDTDTVIMGDLGELQDRSVYPFFLGGERDEGLRDFVFGYVCPFSTA